MQKIIIGSLGAAAVSLGLLFVYNRNNQASILSKDKVLQIIKRIRADMYTILFDIASFVQQNASSLPPTQMRRFILSQDSQYSKKMKMKLQKIFSEYHIDENAFQNHIEKIYKSHAQIQYNIKAYRQQVQKALLGYPPDFKEDCITFMGRDKVLEGIQQILNKKIERIQTKIEDIQRNKNQQISESLLITILKSDEQKDQGSRLKAIRKMGLISQDREAVKIFEFCVQKYIKWDNDFKIKYEKYLSNYNSKLEKIIANCIQNNKK